MQFTAAAVLRLVDQGRLSLDEPIANILPGVPGSDRITVRDLLTERSGLPDINSLSRYDEILQRHQTPASLVAAIGGHPLLFPPGSQFLHEEHSAYNVLALLVGQKTGLPFAAAMRRLVFRPARLKNTFIDDDTLPEAPRLAHGYQPVGLASLEPPAAIHWSGKAGNASVCTTASDQLALMHALFAGSLLTPASRALLLDSSPRVGFGWFRGANSHFPAPAWYMNGRAPGFASFVLYLPSEHLTVVVFSNIYSSATTDIGYDIANIVLGRPHGAFHESQPLPPNALSSWIAAFQFGPDFYQKNAKLAVVPSQGGLALRWPSGDLSPLIPQGGSHFIDRSYWENVTIERGVAGHPTALLYDRFRGTAIPSH